MTITIQDRHYNAFKKIVGDQQILMNEPIRNHTSIKIGGPADYMVSPESVDDLISVLTYIKKTGLPYYIMGNGSNVFATDIGYRGAIIKVSNQMNHIHMEGCLVTAEAGVSLAKLATAIAKQGLTGFEFASGIPGTLGGAVFMNAGAYDGEMKDVLLSVKVIDEKGQIHIVAAKDLDLGYRHSIIQEKPWVVVEATMTFEIGDPAQIKAKMLDLNGRRKEKQPLDLPSAGSAFKRPEGYYAGKLIMDAGLSGYRIGGVSVSTKHCGFIVNDREGTADDLIKLIEYIKREVFSKFDVVLEPEMRLIQ